MIDRYTRPEMGRLFTDKYKFDTWLRLELAVCEAWSNRGVIPKEAYKRIKRKAKFRLRRIQEVEAQVHHDVIAFTTAVADYIGDDSAHFHKGLTSSDIVDTSQGMILKEAGQQLEEMLAKLKKAVGEQAINHKRTPAIGRTHGVHAEPTTLGLKLLIYYDELARHEERLAQAIDGVAVGKLSGAVGNFANIPPDIEVEVLKSLGLQPAPVSNQIVQRDRHAFFVSVLAGIGATLEKIAVNLRTGQRTELGEVQEPFRSGQKGSSAMPHKKNPILLERITGLSRVLRGYAVTAFENMALWDERDISHSGAERVILPDACILLDYMLDKLHFVISDLVVNKHSLRDNIFFTKGLVFSQRVLLALVAEGISREDAYVMVQRNAMRCWEEQLPLLDVLLHDDEVRGILEPDVISGLFTLEPYMEHIDALFERVGLKENKQQRRQEQRDSELDPDTMPVQNIDERPDEYYESAVVATRSLYELRGESALGDPDYHRRMERRKKQQEEGKPGAKKKATPPSRTRRSRRKPSDTKKEESADTQAKQGGQSKTSSKAASSGKPRSRRKPAGSKTEPDKTGKSGSKPRDEGKKEQADEKDSQKKRTPPRKPRRRGGRGRGGAGNAEGKARDKLPSEQSEDDTYVD